MAQPEFQPVRTNPETLRLMLDFMSRIHDYTTNMSSNNLPVPFASKHPFGGDSLTAIYSSELSLGYLSVNTMLAELGGIRYTTEHPLTHRKNTIHLIGWCGEAAEPGFQLWQQQTGLHQPKQLIPIASSLLHNLSDLPLLS